MADNDEQRYEPRSDVEAAMWGAVKRAVDVRLQKALDGKEEWPTLQQYIDSRIEAYFAQRGAGE